MPALSHPLANQPLALFDTHCHLDAPEFDRDRDRVIADARAAGVAQILVPAVEVANFGAVKALCAVSVGTAVDGDRDLPEASSRLSGEGGSRLTRPDSLDPSQIIFCAAFGIHPMYTPRAQDGDLAILRQWLRDDTPVAVGEIGLDGFVPGLDMVRQEWFFAAQLKLAREFDLPVVLHIRRAQDLVLKHLRRAGVRGGIAHAFNGSRQQADEFIRLGFKLGFGGAMTFAGSTRIRALARDLPLEALVLETDAPDIPPSWLNGGRNTPAELASIAAELSALRGIPVAELVRATRANARAVFSACQ